MGDKPEGKVFVVISCNQVGLHIDPLPIKQEAVCGGGCAFIFENSNHPYGSSDHETSTIEKDIGFPLSKADGVVIYVERGTFGAIRNLALAGVADERITYVVCGHYVSEVKRLLKAEGQIHAEIITTALNCGGVIVMGIIANNFTHHLSIR